MPSQTGATHPLRVRFALKGARRLGGKTVDRCQLFEGDFRHPDLRCEAEMLGLVAVRAQHPEARKCGFSDFFAIGPDLVAHHEAAARDHRSTSGARIGRLGERVETNGLPVTPTQQAVSGYTPEGRRNEVRNESKLISFHGSLPPCNQVWQHRSDAL